MNYKLVVCVGAPFARYRFLFIATREDGLVHAGKNEAVKIIRLLRLRLLSTC